MWKQLHVVCVKLWYAAENQKGINQCFLFDNAEGNNYRHDEQTHKELLPDYAAPQGF